MRERVCDAGRGRRITADRRSRGFLEEFESPCHPPIDVAGERGIDESHEAPPHLLLPPDRHHRVIEQRCYYARDAGGGRAT